MQFKKKMQMEKKTKGLGRPVGRRWIWWGYDVVRREIATSRGLEG